MHELYVEKCKHDGLETVKFSKYRQIFNSSYDFSFHVPKKDQCNMCTTYNTAEQNGTATHGQNNAYAQHQEREQRAREENNTDKLHAKDHPNTHVGCFDLQSVLYTPCSKIAL